VPKEITEAQRVLQEGEQIIARAQEEAANIVTLAREQQGRLVGEHELLRRAEVEREGLLEQARQEAVRITGEADAYALGVLEELGQQLTSFQSTVRNGITFLQKQRMGKEEEEGQEAESQ
jgi:vacuolar-type H+-ATPase subunit H